MLHERRDGPVAWLTFDRAERLNAFTGAGYHELGPRCSASPAMTGTRDRQCAEAQQVTEALRVWPAFTSGSEASSQGGGSGFGDSLVLFAAPATDADGADYLTAKP